MRHETVTVSIPVAETWQPRKAMRARSIIGGLLVGLGLIGIVTATVMLPGFSVAKAGDSVPPATAESYCTCVLRRAAGHYTLRVVGPAPSTMHAVIEATNACAADIDAAEAPSGPDN